MWTQLRTFRQRVPWAALAVEVFSVTLGVILGIWATQALEARQERQRAEGYLVAVAAEMEANRPSLERRIADHKELQRRLRASLDAFQAGSEAWPDSIGNPGLGFYSLTDAALVNASRSGAFRFLDIETAERLTGLQTMMEMERELRAAVMTEMGKMNYHDLLLKNPMRNPAPTINAMAVIQNLLVDIIPLEEEMLAQSSALHANLTAFE